MSEEVSWLLTLDMKDLDGFKAVMADMVEATKAEEGALHYEWFIGEDEMTAQIYERYTNSAAAVAHLKTFNERFANPFLAAVAPKGLAVMGEPSEDARKMLTAMGGAFFGPLGGFTK